MIFWFKSSANSLVLWKVKRKTLLLNVQRKTEQTFSSRFPFSKINVLVATQTDFTTTSSWASFLFSSHTAVAVSCSYMYSALHTEHNNKQNQNRSYHPCSSFRQLHTLTRHDQEGVLTVAVNVHVVMFGFVCVCVCVWRSLSCSCPPALSHPWLCFHPNRPGSAFCWAKKAPLSHVIENPASRGGGAEQWVCVSGVARGVKCSKRFLMGQWCNPKTTAGPHLYAAALMLFSL